MPCSRLTYEIPSKDFLIMDLTSTKTCYRLFFFHIFLEMKGKNQAQHFFLNVKNKQRQFKNNCKIIIHKLV